jgi:predicted nucleic acid-binding protein
MSPLRREAWNIRHNVTRADALYVVIASASTSRWSPAVDGT